MVAVQTGRDMFFSSKKRKRFQKDAGWSRMRICGVCLLGHSYEELHARIIHTIDVTYEGKYHLPIRDEKKGKEKKGSAGHRGRRWHGAYCIHHSTKFFSYKVFDLDAGGSYASYTCTLLCVLLCTS